MSSEQPRRCREHGKIVLKYLDIKGLAEPVRLALHIGGVEFEDVRVTYDDVAATKADAAANPTGGVPILSINGACFSQSAALLRWAGRMTGLYPDGGLRQLRVDMVEETLNDLRRAFVPQWYGNALPRDPATGTLPAETALSQAQRDAVPRLINDVYLPARLRQLEEIVGSSTGLRDGGGSVRAEGEAGGNPGPFVCGEDLSIADLSVYVLLEGLTDKAVPYCRDVDATEVLKGLPRLTALVAAVAAHPKVVEWNRVRWNR